MRSSWLASATNVRSRAKASSKRASIALRVSPSLEISSRAGGTGIDLSSKEFALLEAFMRRPGDVLSRFQLLEHAWGHEYENRSNVVDVYIGYVRDKVDRPFDVESIETVRGAGYRFRPDGGI